MAVARGALVAIIAAIAFFAGSALPGSQANAKDLAFWEKSETPKAKKSTSTGERAVGFQSGNNEALAFMAHEQGATDEQIAGWFIEKRKSDIRNGLKPLAAGVLTSAEDVRKRREYAAENYDMGKWLSEARRTKIQPVLTALLG